MAISDKVYQSLKGTIFSQGFTYCGHAVSAAAACAALDIYVKDRVVENVVKVGNHIKQRLEAEFSPLPCVGNIGGMGLNYALELVENKNTKKPIDPATKKELVQNLLGNGIYTRIIGRLGNRLHIGPPCTTTIDEADKALDIIQPLVARLKF
jgi:taurine--2-oxoglutarate transaminase